MNHSPKIFLVCGSGGVGKTTVSAAMGLKFAIEGLKTIVLTIDPAKRLATSLGIESLSDEPKQIDLKKCNAKGEMWAMMLDTKRTFDRIVEKYATSDETKHKILNNKLYQQMSQMLAGTQEYMAIERLYEIYQQDLYDIIIVDTPPMQNAQDFLAAPQKMINMINNSMLHLLLKPTLSLGKSSLNFFEKGSKQILKVFDRITGFAFLQELSEMIIAFKDLLGGFETRAEQINTLLCHPDTGFVIVCTTNEHSIKEAQSFHTQIKSQKFNFKNIIINRVYDGNILSPEKLKATEGSLSGILTSKDINILIHNYKNFIPSIKRDKKQINILNQIINKESMLTIPLYLSDVHNIMTLKIVSETLIKI